jgi:hypothetical protein
MLKYCLSTGRVTTDKVEYIKDLISVNLLLRKSSIPYWSGGSDNLITTLRSEEVSSAVNNVLSDIIEYITTIEPGMSISISSISFDYNIIHIEIYINGKLEFYDISS